MTGGTALDRLTFTRFAAAMIVVCYHLGNGVPLIDGTWWTPLLRAGSAAVTYFFVLSGFVMATVHAELEPAKARSYWRARFARIYPVYLLGLAFCLPGAADPIGWLLNLLLVQAWVPGYALSVTLVGWSLSVELFFYLLFPILIARSRRVRPSCWIGGVALAWLSAQAWTLLVVPTQPDTGFPMQQFVTYFPLPYLASFLVGMSAGLLVRRGQIRLGPAQACMLLAGALAAVGAALLLDPRVGMPGRTGLLAPLFAAGIIAFVHLPGDSGTGALPRLLGEASYALYVLHIPLGPPVAQAIAQVTGPTPLPVFCTTVAVLVGVSVLVFLRFETPVRAALRRGRGAAAYPRRASV